MIVGARVAPVRRRGLFIRLADLYGRLRYGAALRPARVAAHSRRLLAGWGAFELAVERGKLDERLRELAYMETAALVGCPWCIDIGTAVARRHGIGEDKIAGVAAFRESDAYSPLERLTLEYAEAMTVTPLGVSDDLVARLREHLSERELVELTAAIAWENFRARFNHALAIEPQGFAQ